MFVGAVACIDDRTVDPPCGGQTIGRSRGAVPDDDRIGAHGLEG